MTPLETEALTGTRSRTYQTRKVTDEQVNRPLHIAIAVWEEPWKSSPTGVRTEWVLAVNPKGNKPYIRLGTTDEKDPNPHILRELNQELRKANKGKGIDRGLDPTAWTLRSWWRPSSIQITTRTGRTCPPRTPWPMQCCQVPARRTLSPLVAL